MRDFFSSLYGTSKQYSQMTDVSSLYIKPGIEEINAIPEEMW